MEDSKHPLHTWVSTEQIIIESIQVIPHLFDGISHSH